MPESTIGNTGGNPTSPNATTNTNIDIEKLTEKVYQLMRAEIRQEHARGIKRTTRK